MARRSMSRVWIGLSVLAAFSTTLAMGWWLGHLGSPPKPVSARSPADVLRAENEDLRRFIDESYILLNKEGFHIQLELEEDQDGHYRLRTDTAKLTADLKAKLQQLRQKSNQAAPNRP